MSPHNRRTFIRRGILATGAAVVASPLDFLVSGCTGIASKTIRISKFNSNFERETLLKLLDHARKIGAFDQIVIIEEPFAEEIEIDVSDIPVRLAADESAHNVEDAVKRIQMGYKAIALKAIAKTLSMTMKIALAAYERNIPCFCADLTVNPVLVEWNKNVAARLASFPGIGNLGLVESNGHQNYKNWSNMMDYHPQKNAPWVKVKQGVYELNNEFYNTGGVFLIPCRIMKRCLLHTKLKNLP